MHQHYQPDHLGRGVEAAKRAGRQRSRFPAHSRSISAPCPACPACHVGLTEPYLALAGFHEAHPGTGLGFGAQRRAELIAAE